MRILVQTLFVSFIIIGFFGAWESRRISQAPWILAVVLVAICALAFYVTGL